MPTFPRLQRDTALLLVIDVQERLLAAMQSEPAREMVRQIGILLDGARALGVPVVATEQYPKGLGPTIPEIAERLGDSPRIEKVEFSVCASVPAREAVVQSGRKQVILCGMEAHVCVYQTACDLLREGFSVYIPRDAVLSRRESNREVGLSLAEKAGALVTSTETVLFEMVGSAKDSAFKEISRLVR